MTEPSLDEYHTDAAPTSTLAENDPSQPAAQRILGLTNIQRRCLELALDHKSSKQIANLLGVTQHSIDWHMKAAMRKLGVDSRVAAALILRDHSGGESRQRLARQSSEVAAVPGPNEVRTSTNRWSDDNAPVSRNEICDTGPPAEWIAAKVRTHQPAQDHNAFGLNVGVPWGARNTLRIQQRLILIILIAGLSALAFGSILESLEALGHLRLQAGAD